MRLSNGFNKKQKEEIRKIIRSEVRKELRKNSGKDIKEEIIAAVDTVLNEKNEDLVKSLLEIRNKIDKEETEKSFLAANIKNLLHVLCIGMWIILTLLFGIIIYLNFVNGKLLNNAYSVIIFFVVYILLTIVIFVLYNQIKQMNKNDSYNAVMFSISIISLILTIISTKI